ncbi:MAG: hypothetical protein M1447_01635 [Gammaproteobacteria bacterium]|nr:hypothetical protein [Gammaproteobacteria bacterium]
MQDFRRIIDVGFMVNFAIPDDLGIGVVRGPLQDWSQTGAFWTIWDCLDLTVRMVDNVRRLGGPCFPASSRLVDEEKTVSWTTARVCIRGIAEEMPLAVAVNDAPLPFS